MRLKDSANPVLPRIRRTHGPGPWLDRAGWLLHWPLPAPAAPERPRWPEIEAELRSGGLRWPEGPSPLPEPQDPSAWLATLAARLLLPARVHVRVLEDDPFEPFEPFEPLQPCRPASPARWGRPLALWSLQLDLLGEALPLAGALLASLPSLQPLRPAGFEPATLVARLRRLRDLVRRCCGDPFLEAVLAEADGRGIPAWLIEPDNRLYQLGSGARSRWLAATATDADSHFGTQLCHDKSRSHGLLQRLGLPVPRQVLVRGEAELAGAVERVGWPCVVKPIDQEQGRGVHVDLRDRQALLRAWQDAARYGGAAVLVEEQIAGSDHRLTVLGGRFAFAVRRQPPTVRGDGSTSVGRLIERLNREQARRRAADGVSGPVDVDAAVRERLAARGWELDTVPAAREELILRRNANVSSGGSRVDVSEQVHPAIRRMVESLAATLRLDCLGVDLVTPDIARPLATGHGALIELNAMPQMIRERAPQLVAHLFAAPGSDRLPCQVLVLAGEDDCDDALAADLRLRLPDDDRHTVLAVPAAMERAAAWLEALRPELAAAGRLRRYRQPSEILLDASVHRALFLLDRQRLARDGLPVSAPQHLGLHGRSEAAPWPRLDAWLAARLSPAAPRTPPA